MPFEYDIFISYGHLDDETSADDLKGWVDLLVERLPAYMKGPLGYTPKVWRDERSLRGNDVLTGAIREGIERSLILVPVITPRYVLSDWCRRELEMFCSSQSPAGAAETAFRSRVFKVVKTPLILPHVRDKEPEQLRDMVGYSFYEMQDDMPVEFSHEAEPPSKDQRYWDTLRRLAWEITEMLGQLKPDGKMPDALDRAPVADAHAASAPVANAPVVNVPVVNTGSVSTPSASSPTATHAASSNGDGAKPSKTVYLAETTSDLSDEREQVRDELRQRGYGVLPEKQQKLPLESCEALTAAVRSDLERCCLSVHFVGAKYGLTTEDDGRSVVQVQEELAAERRAAAHDFQRLLWTPREMPPEFLTPEGELKDARQRAYVRELPGRISEGSELLRTSVEDLKTLVVEKLDPPKPITNTRPKPKEKFKQIYLICEDSDSDLVWPIKEYLFGENFEVITWLDNGKGDDLMEYHRKNLKECDAALIYFGGGDEPWVRKNLDDLDKAFGYGREDDWCASAVYVGAPASTQKKQFLTRMVPYVIRNSADFKPEDLRDFVSDVRAAEGGTQQ
jgi:hypothetical protein